MEDRRPRKEGGRLGGGEGWRVGVKVKWEETETRNANKVWPDNQSPRGHGH